MLTKNEDFEASLRPMEFESVSGRTLRFSLKRNKINVK